MHSRGFASIFEADLQEFITRQSLVMRAIKTKNIGGDAQSMLSFLYITEVNVIIELKGFTNYLSILCASPPKYLTAQIENFRH
jgi:hypothetical protein